MSIARMVELANVAKSEARKRDGLDLLEATGPAPANTSLPPQDMKDKAASVLAAVVAFIPTEVVAVYSAGLGFFSPLDDNMGQVVTAAQANLPHVFHSPWWLFFLAVVLIPVVIWLNWGTITRPRALTFREGVYLWLMATAAFVAWAAALPRTPFADLVASPQLYGGFGIVIAGVLLPAFARRLDLYPVGATQ